MAEVPRTLWLERYSLDVRITSYIAVVEVLDLCVFSDTDFYSRSSLLKQLLFSNYIVLAQMFTFTCETVR